MEKFCLKWNDFQVNVSNSFSTLRKENDFYDVSLVSDDDKVVSAHKVVLSASSEFFKSILRKADHSKPMIYLSAVGKEEPCIQLLKTFPSETLSQTDISSCDIKIQLRKFYVVKFYVVFIFLIFL